MNTSKIVVSQPSVGTSPSGFPRIHMELYPREVGRLIGYDPRTLIMKPRRSKVGRGTRDLVPHNVSEDIINMQNQVQRSIDNNRVATMVQYLLGAVEREQFANWGAINLVTSSEPDVEEFDRKHEISFDADADYFIADGQHRYCALLDFVREYPQYQDKFTQAITISVLPEGRLVEWAGQEFHDMNYYSVPVRAGKALAVDTRDPVNALAKGLASHPVIKDAGGIAYERDTLLRGDTRFTTHSVLHRFTKGFLFGRNGLEKSADTVEEIDPGEIDNLRDYIAQLGMVLPWGSTIQERDSYLTRSSAVLAGLAVVGHDLYHSGMNGAAVSKAISNLGKVDWRRTNLNLVGVVGSEKDGLVQPASSRQAIDSTIRFLRETAGVLTTKPEVPTPQ